MIPDEILKAAIMQYGEQSQIMMLIEEIGELLQAINKYKRYGSQLRRAILIEEIADVEIMLAQLKIIFRCDEQVDDAKVSKIMRLGERLNSV